MALPELSARAGFPLARDTTGGSPGPVLPAARGPLSSRMRTALLDGCRPDRFDAESEADTDPYGEDLQLALYLAYELHYRGFAAVPADREWDLGVLALRADLEGIFLAALRRDVPGGADVDAAIAALVAGDGESGVSAWLARRGTLEQLRESAVHRSVYHLKEFDPQSWVLARLDRRAKAGLAAVAFDEYGGGSSRQMHSELYAALMTELDLPATYGALVDQVCAPMLASVNLMSLSGLHRQLRGVAVGQLAAVEIGSPAGSQRMSAAARRLGVGPAVEAFYAEHEVADSVHEHVMRRQVVAGLLAEEPELAADVVFGIGAIGFLDASVDRTLLEAWRGGRSSLRVAAS